MIGSIESTKDSYQEFFGGAWERILRYADLLMDQGIVRGVIGPREGSRLWSRHLINCGAIAALAPSSGLVMDIGSGAGLPGIVLAAMRPGVAVELVEPMERRVRWLEDAVAHLDLRNVTVTRARVEELAGQRSVDRVSARAVAPLAKLVKWAGPVLKEGGQLLALKGQLAEEELRQAEGELQRCSFRSAEVRILETVPGVEPTRVVVATRAEAGARGDG